MTAPTGTEIPVDAPRLEAPVTGVLAQVPVITGPEADRWLRGMAFSPESAGTLELSSLCVAENLLGTAQRLANRAVHPFKLSLHDRCSTWGWKENEYEERVTRALDVKRHWAVDREWEKGELIPTNLHLAATYAGQPDPTTVTLAAGAAVSPVNALALLDEAIGNSANVIGRGYIWASAFVAGLWRNAGMLTYENVDDDAGVGSRATILSPAGNHVVIGNGFEGRGPAGTVLASHSAQWAYATDPVVVVQGTPETTPGTMIEATDFGTNTVVFRQEQWLAVLWAGLLHAAVLVSTDTPAVEGGGGGGGGGAGQTTTMAAEDSSLLLASATRNGATYATGDYARFRAFASSDQAGTLNIQQSRTGSTWYTTVTTAVAAGSTTGTVLESIITMPFIRAQYVNGATNQGAFEFDTARVGI